MVSPNVAVSRDSNSWERIMNLLIKAAALATLSAATAASFEPFDRPDSQALCLAAARVQLPPVERPLASLRELAIVLPAADGRMIYQGEIDVVAGDHDRSYAFTCQVTGARARIVAFRLVE
jgi:hypothetical protein